MESIKILLDGNNRSLLNFARMNKFKDDELYYICIELRKYLQNKWKDLNLDNETSVLRAYLEIEFWHSLRLYFIEHERNKHLLYFINNTIIKNLTLQNFIEILNIPIETIESNIKNIDSLMEIENKRVCYKHYEEFETPDVIYKTANEPNKIGKNNRVKAVALYEDSCKQIYDMYDSWILAREKLLDKYSGLHKIDELKNKFIEFALLNDIASIFDTSIKPSEYKYLLEGEKINKNITKKEILDIIQKGLIKAFQS